MILVGTTMIGRKSFGTGVARVNKSRGGAFSLWIGLLMLAQIHHKGLSIIGKATARVCSHRSKLAHAPQPLHSGYGLQSSASTQERQITNDQFLWGQKKSRILEISSPLPIILPSNLGYGSRNALPDSLRRLWAPEANDPPIWPTRKVTECNQKTVS